MAHFTLLVGSTLGSAEDLADDLAQLLRKYGHQEVIHTSPQLDHILIKPEHYLLLICSTHGAGDLPDNIEPFYQQLLEQQPNLNGVNYLAIGLGDSAYDTFCGAIKTLTDQLYKLGATAICDPLTIDVSLEDPPEQIATQWLDPWLKTTVDP